MLFPADQHYLTTIVPGLVCLAGFYDFPGLFFFLLFLRILFIQMFFPSSFFLLQVDLLLFYICHHLFFPLTLSSFPFVFLSSPSLSSSYFLYPLLSPSFLLLFPSLNFIFIFILLLNNPFFRLILLFLFLLAYYSFSLTLFSSFSPLFFFVFLLSFPFSVI